MFPCYSFWNHEVQPLSLPSTLSLSLSTHIHIKFDLKHVCSFLFRKDAYRNCTVHWHSQRQQLFWGFMICKYGAKIKPRSHTSKFHQLHLPTSKKLLALTKVLCYSYLDKVGWTPGELRNLLSKYHNKIAELLTHIWLFLKLQFWIWPIAKISLL